MPAEVVVRDIGEGRATVHIDGQKIAGVRAVTVDKRVGDRDIVTIEIVSRRTTILPEAGAEADVP